MRVSRRSLSHAGLSLVAAIALVVAACSDTENNPVLPGGPDPLTPQSPDPIAVVECKVDVRLGSVNCGAPDPNGGSARSVNGIYLGDQGVNVKLTSSNIQQIAPDTFAFDVTLQNLIPQAIGTTDGSSADPAGSQIFFHSGPNTTGGSGSVTVGNPDGIATFTATNQPYFKYVQKLATSQISAAHTWKLRYDPTVTNFSFLLFVYTPVQYPQGWIDIAPPADTIEPAQNTVLTATVRNRFGVSIGGSVNWASSNTDTATVTPLTPNTAQVNGLAPGHVTITATQASGMGAPYDQRTGTASIVVKTTPAFQLDTFPNFENVTTVRDSSKGLLRKWSDPDGNPLSVVPGTFTSVNSGRAVVASDGSFNFVGAPGFNGTDSLHYTVSDGVHSIPAVAVLPVTNTHVWYVQPAFAGVSDGRDQFPFTTITAAEGVAVAGDSILVLANGANQVTDAATLKNTQALLGQGIPSSITKLTADGVTVTYLAAGAAPGLTRTSAGAMLTLAQNNTVRGVGITAANGAAILGSSFGTLTTSDIGVNPAGPALDLTTGVLAATFTTLSSTNSLTHGLNLSGVSGTLTVAGGAISKPAGSGNAFNLASSTLTFNYPGSINNGAGRAVAISTYNTGTLTLSGSITDSGTGIDVTGVSGGGVDFSGALSLTGQGINVHNNSGGSIAFSNASKTVNTGANAGVIVNTNPGATVTFGGGGLAVTTSSGNGFNASGGGTVSVTGAGNTLTSTTGTTLTLNGVATGASGLSFVSVANNGGPSGIAVSSITGAGVQVTGSGVVSGSGGTIQNTTSHSVSVSTLSGVPVSLANLTISGAGSGGNAGIFGSGTDSLVVANVSVSATSGPALSLSTSKIKGSFSLLSSAGSNSNGVILTTVSGSFSAAAGSITNPTSTAFAVVGGTVSATYSGGMTQAVNNAALVSVSGGHSGGTLTFNTGTLTASTGTGLQFNNADGSYAFDGTTTLNGGDAGIDVLAGSGGSFGFASGVAITNPSGVGLFVDASAPALTYAGSISTNGSSGRPVHIQGVTGGSIDVSGSVTSTGLGILVQNNTGGLTTFSGSTKSLSTTTNTAVSLITNAGHPVSFTGGNLQILTTTGAGFSATGSGTIAVTGSNNDISTGAGTALNLNGVTVGASNLVLDDLSSSGASNAINLTSVVGTGTISTVSGTVTGVAGGAPVLVSGGSANLTWNGNITQAANNALLSVAGGHTGSLNFNTGTLSATAGTGLQFDNADGNYTFGNTTTTTLNGGDAGIDVSNGSGGTFSFNANTSLTNSSGTGILVNASAPTFTYSGRLTKTNGTTGISLTSNTGGSFNFGSRLKQITTSGGNVAMNLATNGTATITSTDSLQLSGTGAGTLYNATGGGTLTVSGANNTASSTGGGTAVNVSSTTISGSGITFKSVSATGSGTNGIVLSSSGAGPFTVTGDGASDAANTTRGRTTAKSGGGTITLGSGGTISGRSGDGVNLSTTGPVTLRNMVISGGSADGIDATSVNGLVLDNLQVTGHANNRGVGVNSTSGFKVFHSEITNNATSVASSAALLYNLQLADVTGTDSIMSSQLKTAYAFVLKVDNGSGTLNMRVQNTEITGATNGIAVGVYPAGSSNVTAIFDNDSIGHSSARGLQSGTTTGSSATYNLTVNNTAFRNNFVAIDNAHGSGGSYTYSITNNRLQTNVASSAQAINVNRLGSSTFTTFGLYQGTISGNVIGTAGVANSGSDVGDGINVEMNGSGGIMRSAILNNTIREVGQRGIYLASVDTDIGGGAVPLYETRVQSNNIANMEAVALDGIQVVMGALSTDNPTMCLNIGGAGAGNTVSAAPRNGIRVRTSGLPSSTPTLRLQGWDGVTAPATFFANQNPAATGAVANTNYSLGGGSVSAATCTTP